MRLEGVESQGKNLLLDFGELSLHSHLGMNGSWHVYPPGERWRKPRRAAWAVLRGERAEAVQFGGPTLRVLRTAPLGWTRELARLGPDSSPPTSTAVELDRLACAPPATGSSAMSCSTRAGSPGSATSSRARPASPPASTPGGRSPSSTTRSSAAVLRAARELMQAAVESGRHPRTVYRRAGWPCLALRHPGSARRGQGDANRTTYWCPSCQSG